MPARALMFQGTGSDVGKSTVVAAMCRLLARQGLRVRPFKPQNMSNNAAVTADGGEIGRAQALQARACGVAPSVHMNPVLLKPESDTRSQVVVQGRVRGAWQARAYQNDKPQLLGAVLESFRRLQAEADIVLIEGAGSPAETNLRTGDIANMGFALAADVPVCLVADIDRGGVIASVVGTRAVLDAADRAAIIGYVVNKFRGDPTLFDEGISHIGKHTGWPCFGVLPWQAAAARLPAEDGVALERPVLQGAEARMTIAVPMLSRIANFDDLDPLKAEPGVRVMMVPPGTPLPRDADVIVLPGTKATIADLDFMRSQGWDIDVRAHVRHGGSVIGLCGGYQMLGTAVADPLGLEGPPRSAPGLGLLDVETVLEPGKTVVQVHGRHLGTGEAISGYEIHVGSTRGPDCRRPVLRLEDGQHDGRYDGAQNSSGRVIGTYVHGLFGADGFRRALLRSLHPSIRLSPQAYEAQVDAALDDMADALARHVRVEALLQAAR